MKKIPRFLGVLAIVMALSVFPFHAASAQTGLYFGVFGGYAFNPDASWEDDDFDTDLDIDDVWLFGVKIGYTPPPLRFFSFEFEYSYLDHDVDRTALKTGGADYDAIEGDAEIHNFMVNAIVKYPEGRIHPYFGIGIGASYADISVTATSNVDGADYREKGSSDETVFAWQVLVGIDIDLTKNLSLDIGYRYFDTEEQDDDYYDYYYDDDHDHDHYHDDDHHHHDDTAFDYSTSMVTVGLKYRF